MNNQVPACRDDERRGGSRLVPTVSSASLNKYEKFKQSSRELIRQGNVETIDVTKLTAPFPQTSRYRRPGLSPIGVSGGAPCPAWRSPVRSQLRSPQRQIRTTRAPSSVFNAAFLDITDSSASDIPERDQPSESVRRTTVTDRGGDKWSKEEVNEIFPHPVSKTQMDENFKACVSYNATEPACPAVRPARLDRYCNIPRRLNYSVSPVTAGRMQTVLPPTAPLPSRSLRKVKHSQRSLIHPAAQTSSTHIPRCIDTCESSFIPPPDFSPIRRAGPRQILNQSRPSPPRAIPRDPHRILPAPPVNRIFQTHPNFSPNVNLLTATSYAGSSKFGGQRAYPAYSTAPCMISERPAKTIKRTTIANTGNKKVVTEELSEIFEDVKAYRSRSPSPCPTERPRMEEPFKVARQALPQSECECQTKEMSGIFEPQLTGSPLGQPYVPKISPDSGSLSIPKRGATRCFRFNENPSRVMRTKRISDAGSMHVVSEEIKQVYDETNVALKRNQNSPAIDKVSITSIIKLFLEVLDVRYPLNSTLKTHFLKIMNELLKLNSLNA